MTSAPEIASWNDAGWPALLEAEHRLRLAELLLSYVRQRRWFRAKARSPRVAQLADVIPLDPSNVLVILRIDYEQRGDGDGDGDGAADLYAVPLGYVDEQSVAALATGASQAIIARLGARPGAGALVDGLLVPGHAAETLFAILGGLGGRDRAAGEHGEVRGEADALFTQVAGAGAGAEAEALPVTIPRADQTNSTAIFGDRALLKVYRELIAAPNPELEVGRHLTRHGDPSRVPRVLGALWYRAKRLKSKSKSESVAVDFSLGIAHEYLNNDGDAWTQALEELRAYFSRTAAFEPPPAAAVRAGVEVLLARALEADPNVAAALSVGPFLRRASTLGRRTGELHMALASGSDDPAFAAEPLSRDDRRQMAARAESMLNEELDALPALFSRLTPEGRTLAQRLLADPSRSAIAARLAAFGEDGSIDVVKTRTHGDLHLGQVLCRGEDFVIVDFEGEPARPLAERRAKSSPLRDVMGMIRSFDYAPQAVLREPLFEAWTAEQARRLGLWAAVWTAEVTVAYLRGYLTAVADAGFIPRLPGGRDQLGRMLGFYELEKVIYETRYEANNRPDWLEIPLRGLAAMAAGGAGGVALKDSK